MKAVLLNGRELAEYIQERQGRQVRALRQADGVEPRLAIILTVDNPIIEIYIRLKQRYGAELGVEVDIHRVTVEETPALIEQLNNDATVHGIIVQLPLADPTRTDEIVNMVAPAKDVDALGVDAIHDPATPTAILWLLSGFNVDLRGKRVLLIGRGKLVGAPLERILLASEVDVRVATRQTPDLKTEALAADVIVTATGQPGILTSEMVKPDAVVVDAGVASEDGKTVGDVADDVYARTDVTLTPKKGGVGPLTVCALFDNVIRAARATIEDKPHVA